MKRSLVLALVLPAAAALAATTLLSRRGIAAPAPAEADLVARGKYMVTTMACADCHTPWILTPQGPQPDPKRWLSGHPQDLPLSAPPPSAFPWIVMAAATNTAWAGPWGVSFTANLTPDPETGLGSWTFEQFRDALRTGRHQGKGRPILPPMPQPAYAHLSDADLQALFAYLRSLPPIVNRVPAPLPPAEVPAAPAAK